MAQFLLVSRQYKKGITDQTLEHYARPTLGNGDRARRKLRARCDTTQKENYIRHTSQQKGTASPKPIPFMQTFTHAESMCARDIAVAVDVRRPRRHFNFPCQS